MTRSILPLDRIDSHIQDTVLNEYQRAVQEVRTTIENQPLVVVGMKHNPHVIRARKALKKAGIAFTYLEYGSYTDQWRLRTAIKMWSGWHTFPQVFVRGTLIGGANETVALIENGELARRLNDHDA